MTMHNAHMIAHFFVGYGGHNGLVPPSVVPVLQVHISTSTLLGLGLKAKYSPTVLGQLGIPLVARGNDSGFMISHFGIPANDTLVPVTMALAGSKVVFGSSKTLIWVDNKAEQCGCCLPPFLPLSQNQACNDPCSYPGDYVIAPNNVEVGMTLGDIIAGLITAALDTAFSKLVSGALAGGISKFATGLVARQIAQRSFWQFAADIGPEAATRAMSSVAANVMERSSLRMLDEVLKEAAKSFIVEPGFDAAFGYASADGEGTVGGTTTDAGLMTAGLCGQGPAADPRVYGADGTVQLLP